MTADLWSAIEYHLERARPNEFKGGKCQSVAGGSVIIKPSLGRSSNTLTAIKPSYIPASPGDYCVVTRSHKNAPWVLMLTFSPDRSQSTSSPNLPEKSSLSPRSGKVALVSGSLPVPASSPTVFASQAFQLSGGPITLGANISVTMTSGTGWITNQVQARLNGETIFYGITDQFHMTYRPAGIISFTCFAANSLPGTNRIELEAFTSGGSFTMTSSSQVLEV